MTLNDQERIGVYVCHCGTNIAGIVDVAKVAEWAAAQLKHRGVVIARDYKFMCSSLGQELIEKDIKELGLNRVVVAACSPHLHEKTFRTACANAGLNPFMCEMVSIREQVSWVHTDKAAATAKAKAMISGGVERVRHHVPLQAMTVPIHPATLVVGGGIAGIQSALEIADAGFHVYMVEREPSIGGHMSQFDKTFPTLDCAACILTPKMVSVGSHPNITLLTWSEVEKVEGYIGNFTVTVRKKARKIKEDLCTGCGICQEKCPKKVIDDVFEAGLSYRKAVYTPFPQAVPNIPVMDVPNCTYYEKGTCKACEKFCPTEAIDFDQQDEILTFQVGNIVLATGYDLFDARRIGNYGYGRLPNVFTSLEMERLFNAAGPTQGNLVMRDGKTAPKSVGIVHCVGSRDKNFNNYCSSICCMQSIKFAHLVKERTGATVYNFYIDVRTPGKDYDEFYQRVVEEGTMFVRGKVAEVTDVPRSPAEQGKLIIQVEDTLAGKQRRIPVDMVDPVRGPGAAQRLQGDRQDLWHFLLLQRLVHREASEARSGGDHDRRHLHRRLCAGSQGYSGERCTRRGRGGPRAGEDRTEGSRAGAGACECGGGAMLRLPHLQLALPVQCHQFPRRPNGDRDQSRPVPGLRHVHRGLPGRRHSWHGLQQ